MFVVALLLGDNISVSNLCNLCLTISNFTRQVTNLYPEINPRIKMMHDVSIKLNIVILFII